MNFNKTQIKNILLIITFTILLFYGINNLPVVTGGLIYIFSIIKPFVLGGCIAFVVNIPMKFYVKKLNKVKGKKAISLVLSYLTFIVIIVLLINIITPQLIETAKVIPETFQNAVAKLTELINDIPALSATEITQYIKDLEINWLNIFDNIKNVVFSSAGSMINSTIGVATSVATSAFNFFIGFIFSVYLLVQKEKLAIQVKKLLLAFIPVEKVNAILEIAKLSSDTFSNFLSGQCTEAVIIGVIYFVVLNIFRFPYAIVISVVIACTSIIPVIGAFIGCLFGAFLIVMVDPFRALIFIILFVVVQQLEGNLIYPRVVGGSIGLPSMWVLVAVTVGGSLMGIAGILLFIPLCSVLYALLRKTVYKRLDKKRIDINTLNIKPDESEQNEDGKEQ